MSVRLAGFASGLGAVLLVCTAAGAQPETSEPQEPSVEQNREIVVQGQRFEERKQELREQLRVLIAESGNQIARVENRVCPSVLGLRSADAREIKRLILDNARQLGLEQARMPCVATATVIFNSDPHGFMNRIRRKEPAYFSGMRPAQIKRLVDEVRPAYAWQTIDMRDADDPKGRIVKSPENDRVMRPAYLSRIYSSATYAIDKSFLVLDTKRTKGMTLQQIADFATLHLLLQLQADSNEKAREGSILRLFHVDDPASMPEFMDDFDWNMLQSVYAVEANNRAGSQQRRQIANKIIAQEDRGN